MSSFGTAFASPLQCAQVRLYAVLEDARDGLGEREYEAFLDLACRRLARETARLARWDEAA